MMWETHILGSILIVISGEKMGFFSPNLMFITAIWIGTLLPDIDTPKSLLGHKIKPISSLINFFAGHRKMLHSLLGFFLFMFIALAISLITENIAFAFMLGYVSHLFLDSLTPQGVYLFYPLKNRTHGPIRCNSIGEKIFFTLLLCMTLYVRYG
jgi:inner membrane protein